MKKVCAQWFAMGFLWGAATVWCAITTVRTNEQTRIAKEQLKAARAQYEDAVKQYEEVVR